MNGWLFAAAALLVCGVAPALWGVSTGPLRRRVVAQNQATLLVCLALLLLAQGFGRSFAYTDLALVLAVLGPVGTLVYARLLADDLADDPPHSSRTTWPAVAATVLVVLPLCVVTGPARATAKLLVIGALLIAGNVVASRALDDPVPEAAPHD
ncbi:monovalent cation/H+ antiporter complex subunit F [Streptomyces sp. NPDC006649]|uniref:monovalent cation/H+ antiporter complex subunit F n=1 Tax=Streptomyces sp. NPDC006649 TaxID=3156896 RepID=UPI0033AD7F6D